MKYNLISFSRTPPAVSAGFSSMINVFVFILLAFVVLLLLILFCIYINTILKVKQKEKLRRSIDAAAGKALAAKTKEEAAEPLLAEELFTRRGLAVLAEVLDDMDSKNKRKLRKILLEMGIGKNLAMQLEVGKEDYLMEIIHLAGELEITELCDDILSVMMKYNKNIGIQYEAFLALSRLGSHDQIVQVCKQKDFAFALSFRSLQEIIETYSGDKPGLYKELLGSPDAYITRICIRRIGYEQIYSLADDIMPFLDSDNINLIDDTMRSLGMLGHKPASQKIAAFLTHEKWEVRGVAVSALAALGAQDHIDEFIKAMQDSEWQVRYNAGAALASLKDISGIKEKVAATGDKFTIDMWEYMTGMKNINEK